MPRKRYSTAPKFVKKKPHLEWRVITATASNLQDELQQLTDAKWRVFAICTHGEQFIVSAYLSAWTAVESDTEEPPA